MNDLERQYLIAAYEASMRNPRRSFREDQALNNLDTSDPSYVGHASA